MNRYFEKLYQYNYWANIETLKFSGSLFETDAYLAETFSHVINAQYIWIARFKGETARFKVRQVHTPEALTTLIPEIGQVWLDYVRTASPEELDRKIHYTNSFGETFTSTIQDCVIHLVNHSSYHRGQIARAARLAGVAPINTDFITYCRLLDAGEIIAPGA